MDEELARWLVSPAGAKALVEAAAQDDPDSLAAAEALRRRWTGAQAAAALSQVSLRRKARAKFGRRAEETFLTRDGLEQATRLEVARWRASRFAAAGLGRVADLGCGIGADSLAFLDAGHAVEAVEADPATAVFAQANLGSRAVVHLGDAVELAAGLLADGAAFFVDPARRTAAGRTWRPADLSPPWGFVESLLDGHRGCVKAAPGLPLAYIPDDVACTWVSHRGDLVEASLWSAPWPAGSRRAVLLPSGDELEATQRRDPPVGPVAAYLYEPDPAVIRAGAIGTLAQRLDAWAIRPGIAYLFAEAHQATRFATAFEVLEVLPHDERSLRAWVRERGIGTLEIKVRGLDVDPAKLRRRLSPAGKAAATIVLTPTPAGARGLVVRRLRTEDERRTLDLS